MKIIISHDVDHLYVSDHWLKDLFIEKLWVRSLIQLIKREINIKTFLYRLLIPFHNRMHRIDELMDYDKEHQIPSIFFFGMANALGISYSRIKAKPIIERLIYNGFDVGVHGISYQAINEIRKEHDEFKNISGMKSFGIRNHYVRFDKDTFIKQSEVGYLFDSTWFDREQKKYKMPYKVGGMWEFPLYIMDVYSCKEGKREDSIIKTKKQLRNLEKKGIAYCTVLFHDMYFNEKFSPELKKWYMEIIKYCEESEYEFISYRKAIEELEYGRI